MVKYSIGSIGRSQCTVFAPLAMCAGPTGRAGIIGIGGLGRMAVTFLPPRLAGDKAGGSS
jgi:hypothetical protein